MTGRGGEPGTERTLVIKSVLVTASILTFALGLYVLWELRSLLTTLVFASLVAYILNPVVARLERIGVNRTLGIILVTAIVFAAIVLLILLIVPVVQRELLAFFADLPSYFERAKVAASYVWERLFDESFPSDVQSFMDALAPRSDAMQSTISGAAQPVGKMIAGAFSGIVGFIAWLVGVAIMPVVIFYLLRDFDKITDGAIALIPVERRDLIVGVFRDINQTIGHLIRGQLIVAIALSVIYSVGLLIIGVPYWIILGIVSGFAYIIPYFSLVIGFIPAAIVAGIYSEPWWEDPLWVALLYVAAQALEGFLLTPKIVGKSVGLHPLAIILALLVFGSLLGPLGVLIAVPAAAILNVLWKHAHRKIKSRTAEAELETAAAEGAELEGLGDDEADQEEGGNAAAEANGLNDETGASKEDK